MGSDELKLIRNKIREKNHSWSAGLTSLAHFSLDEKKKYLGLVVEDGELEINKAKIKEEEDLIASQGRVFAFPGQWDWRSVSGKDWTTPIRNQAGCGACVAFATVAMIEACLEIFKRDPSLDPDLSEADLFFRGCGNCCARGWNFMPALKYAKSSGIPDEACFPYDDNTGRSCPDRDKRAIKINNWRILSNASQVKEWISTRGPVMTGMEVCEDFFYYEDGIYTYDYGGFLGYHAICIIGYSDAEKCWICKNSWGKGWGNSGWFKIAYGECGIGGVFPFYTAEFSSNNDLVMPKTGRVLVRFKSRETAFNNDIRLHYPQNKPLFNASNSNLGKVFDAGTFTAGTRLIFALETPDKLVYYTDSSLNSDTCDHVKMIPLGTFKWELRWEDMEGLGEQDYNDVIMEVEITDKPTDDIVLPASGKVLARFKSKSTTKLNEFRLYSPKDMHIFNATDSNVGESFDVGAFSAGAKLTFALKTQDGKIYFTDSALNPDANIHVKKLSLGNNRWVLRWEDLYNLADKDYDDLIVEIELVPSINNDIILPAGGRVKARFIGKRTALENEFRLFQPEDRSIFMAIDANLGKIFDLGIFSAGTRLVFALKTSENKTYYTDSAMNADGKSHVFKLPLGSTRWQLRWEDLYDLKDKDYNDLIVEISITRNASEDEKEIPIHAAEDCDINSIDNHSPAEVNEVVPGNLSQYMSSSVSGATDDSYATILSWNCLSYLKKTLVLACTHSSNDLKYRIRGYAKAGSKYYTELWTETTLSHGDVQPFVIENHYNSITVEVKSAATSKASSYCLDYCGGP